MCSIINTFQSERCFCLPCSTIMPPFADQPHRLSDHCGNQCASIAILEPPWVWICLHPASPVSDLLCLYNNFGDLRKAQESCCSSNQNRDILVVGKAKLKLESGNQKTQYGHQAAILKVTSLKINRLPPMTAINMHLKFEIEIRKLTWLTLWKPCHLQSPETEKSNMAPQAAILIMLLLKINRLLPIYISIVLLKFEVDIQSQSKVRVRKPKNPIWPPGFCLWPPSTCIWNLKLKFQSKLELCSGNHVVYRQTDGQTDARTRWIQYTPPPTSLGGDIKTLKVNFQHNQCIFLLLSKPENVFFWFHKDRKYSTLIVHNHAQISVCKI